MATSIKGLASFDWDDTELQKAYDKGVKLRSKFLEKMERKSKDPKKNGKENAESEKKWKVGAFCRAVYSVDEQLYEAKICSFGNGGMCTVEFIGYGDKQSVSVKELKESCGKQARKNQSKSARSEYEEGYSSGRSTTSEGVGSRRAVSTGKMNESRPYESESYNYPTADNSTYSVPQPHIPTCCAPPIPGNIPFLSKVPSLPISQYADPSQNSLTAMLVSWYMAGYYTGLHQAQKGTHCSQHSCTHANQYCRH